MSIVSYDVGEMNTTIQNPLEISIKELILEHLKPLKKQETEYWKKEDWEGLKKWREQNENHVSLLESVARVCRNLSEPRYNAEGKIYTVKCLIEGYFQGKNQSYDINTDRGSILFYFPGLGNCPDKKDMWDIELTLLTILEEWMKDKPKEELFEKFVTRRRLIHSQQTSWDQTETLEDLSELDSFDLLKNSLYRYHCSVFRQQYFERIFVFAKKSDELFFVVKHSRRCKEVWEKAVLQLSMVIQREKRREKKRNEQWSAYNYENKIYVDNLNSFKISQFTGIIEKIDKGVRHVYGSLRIRLRAKNRTEVFFTKIRKRQKFRKGQKVTFYTLKNLNASAWRHDLNVVRIDIDGVPVYRWQKGEVLYVYDGCGNG